MMWKPGQIRALAICIFSYDHSILVIEGYDPLKDQSFYRPLGGGIEFGEYGYAALAREIREEVQAAISQPRYLGTLENIFSYNGQLGHEIVQVYDAEFVDRSLYQQPVIPILEDDGSVYRAVWKSLIDFQSLAQPLYPDGLIELLQREGYL